MGDTFQIVVSQAEGPLSSYVTLLLRSHHAEDNVNMSCYFICHKHAWEVRDVKEFGRGCGLGNGYGN